jgi:pyrimidine operon attenuation protein / uracil phosphoribosyltransferase
LIELNRTEHYLNALEASLHQEITRRGLQKPIMIGIHRGGVWVAERLHESLALEEPLGRIDISFYRDDFSRAGLHPTVQASSIPVPVDGRDVILIDDVFYTGRTVRAALNELFDYGRPNQVVLGVLIERNGREIPIRPDCSGAELTLSRGERIKLSGPSPLMLSVHVVTP